jgi:hypothetical protein
MGYSHMTTRTITIVVLSLLNGVMVSMGYAVFIEKFVDLGPLFVIGMIAHVILLSYLTVRGILYGVVWKMCQEQLDVMEEVLEKK